MWNPDNFQIDIDNIKEMDNFHYDITKIDSYNKSMNIILTGLASGKTTRVKKKIFDAFLKKGHKFLWVVRQVKDLDNEFLAEFMNEFEGYNYFIDNKRLVADDIDGNRHVVGYFVALSSANSFKRLALPGIYYIVYDEFILDPYVANNRYVPGEMKNLLILWDKVGRFTGFKTKLYLMGNPVEIANPLFSTLSIDPMEVRRNKNKIYVVSEDIVVDYCDTPSTIRRQRENTPYARVARRLPDYYEMAFNSAEEYQKNVKYIKSPPEGFRQYAKFRTSYGDVYIMTGPAVTIDDKLIGVYVTDKSYGKSVPIFTFDSKKWNGVDTTLIDQFTDEKKTIKWLLSLIRTNKFAASNENVYMQLRDIIGYFK